MATFLRQVSGMLKAGGNVGRAEKLERQGRLADARVALLQAIEATGLATSSLLEPATASSRFVATTALARIAALLHDRVEATQYARAGLALWAEARLAVPAMRDVNGFAEWESWARAYLEREATQDEVPVGMKIEFIPDGAPETPLILIKGRDGEAVRALRDAIARADRGPFAVHAVRGVEPVGGCHLAAALGDRDRGVRQVGKLAFEWVLDAEGWAQVNGLLKPFEDPTPGRGFQYLSREGEVRVLISRDGRW
ncbi:hypothetical protein [Anaeromyxobacter diazotrophicus]|uniref:Uncharacterized protein n=1 Tax=Anaeromyxobacter diazotrophicus TaxID=2590199 RepID=A0A7I9VIV2_9BACT|nr:hypothetical protein [Anaeromyxobacter diazotrophicus]GEJ55957.1 hypothetical protein AMYX_06980 [Anaeromyxobacter diazotrophicus]